MNFTQKLVTRAVAKEKRTQGRRECTQAWFLEAICFVLLRYIKDRYPQHFSVCIMDETVAG